ncbi:MAG: quinolinate synthase, partial [bacterium (Candidatus Ratteibacteria) CG01_land_8_20_14_3_00_40_19]
AVCPNMKLITLEKVLWALEDLQYEVKIPDNIRIRAKQSVERMLQIS